LEDDMTSDSKKLVLVLVHGVGATEPGNMVRELCGELAGPDTKEEFSSYKYIKLDPPGEARYEHAYELHWADLKPNGNGFWARLRRPLHVMLGLSQIGAEGWGDTKSGITAFSLAGRMLHAFLWGIALSLSAIYFPLFHMTVLPPGWREAAAILSILPGFFLALSLYKFDKWACLSAFLTPALGLASMAFWAFGDVTVQGSAMIAAVTLTAIYATVIGLTALALFELGCKAAVWGSGQPLHCYVVRFAALTLPFTLLGGGLGALSWAVNLWISTKFGPGLLAQWDTAYTEALPFDLALLEFAFAVATFAFGAVLAVAGVIFFIGIKLKSSETAKRELGNFLRNSIMPALVVLAIGNTIVSALFLANVILFPREEILEFPLLRGFSSALRGLGVFITGEAGLAITAFAVYAASSTRIVSFIPSLIGKLRQPAAIIADVVLWLVPDGELSYRTKARERLNALLKGLAPQFHVLILAHSQGTVVAWDTLNNSDLKDDKGNALKFSLITAGSPIDTLYRPFLAFKMLRPDTVSTWSNYYRLSDYVGGRVGCAKNTTIEQDYRMNHLNYFRSAEIITEIGGFGSKVEQCSMSTA
jgi:hypothetical protein